MNILQLFVISFSIEITIELFNLFLLIFNICGVFCTGFSFYSLSHQLQLATGSSDCCYAALDNSYLSFSASLILLSLTLILRESYPSSLIIKSSFLHHGEFIVLAGTDDCTSEHNIPSSSISN